MQGTRRAARGDVDAASAGQEPAVTTRSATKRAATSCLAPPQLKHLAVSENTVDSPAPNARPPTRGHRNA